MLGENRLIEGCVVTATGIVQSSKGKLQFLPVSGVYSQPYTAHASQFRRASAVAGNCGTPSLIIACVCRLITGRLIIRVK